MQLEVSILEARIYCPMYTIPSRLGSIRHQLQSSIGTVEKLAYCGILQQQMLVAKCAPEHKRFLLQPSMQILSSLDNAVYITSSQNNLLACFLKLFEDTNIFSAAPFPMPKRRDVVSHPVIACKAGSNLQISSPNTIFVFVMSHTLIFLATACFDSDLKYILLECISA